MARPVSQWQLQMAPMAKHSPQLRLQAASMARPVSQWQLQMAIRSPQWLLQASSMARPVSQLHPKAAPMATQSPQLRLQGSSTARPTAQLQLQVMPGPLVHRWVESTARLIPELRVQEPPMPRPSPELQLQVASMARPIFQLRPSAPMAPPSPQWHLQGALAMAGPNHSALQKGTNASLGQAPRPKSSNSLASTKNPQKWLK